MHFLRESLLFFSFVIEPLEPSLNSGMIIGSCGTIREMDVRMQALRIAPAASADEGLKAALGLIGPNLLHPLNKKKHAGDNPQRAGSYLFRLATEL